MVSSVPSNNDWQAEVQVMQAKLENAEKNLIEGMSASPLLVQQAKKVGALVLVSLALIGASIVEGIRTFGGIRGDFDIGPEKRLFKVIKDSKPLPPEAAKKVNDALKTIAENFRLYEIAIKSHLVEDSDKIAIYRQLAEYSDSAEFLQGIDNGIRRLEGLLEALEKLKHVREIKASN